MSVLKAVEFESASGHVQLQFLDLLGTGLGELAFQVILGLEEEEFVSFLEKYQAEIVRLKDFFYFRWSSSQLKEARLFKNMLNKKAREKKVTGMKVLEFWKEINENLDS